MRFHVGTGDFLGLAVVFLVVSLMMRDNRHEVCRAVMLICIASGIYFRDVLWVK